MNKRVIYFIYMMILVSAVFYRTVKADSRLEWQEIVEGPIINSVELVKLEGGTDVVIGLNERIKPKTFFLAKENAIVLDFMKVGASTELADAFSNDDLKLGYVINGGDKTRIKLFVRAENKMKLVYDENNVVVSLRNRAGAEPRRGKAAQSLVEPTDRKFSQAVLSFSDSDFETVVRQLASEAEIEVELGEGLPLSISASFETSTPFEALRSIAIENDLKFYNSGKGWFISGV
jgi:hypothetical protein